MLAPCFKETGYFITGPLLFQLILTHRLKDVPWHIFVATAAGLIFLGAWRLHCGIGYGFNQYTNAHWWTRYTGGAFGIFINYLPTFTVGWIEGVTIGAAFLTAANWKKIGIFVPFIQHLSVLFPSALIMTVGALVGIFVDRHYYGASSPIETICSYCDPHGQNFTIAMTVLAWLFLVRPLFARENWPTFGIWIFLVLSSWTMAIPYAMAMQTLAHALHFASTLQSNAMVIALVAAVKYYGVMTWHLVYKPSVGQIAATGRPDASST